MNQFSGAYTTNSTTLTTYISRHEETEHGTLSATSDLADKLMPTPDNVEQLVSGSFDADIGNNQLNSESSQEGNFITGASILTTQSISLMTLETVSENQTLSSSATITSASVATTVDRANTVTGQYQQSEQSNHFADYRTETDENQTEATDIVASSDSTVQTFSDGNKITGDFAITEQTSQLHSQLQQMSNNQTATSEMTASTDEHSRGTGSGNSISGEYTRHDELNTQTDSNLSVNNQTQNSTQESTSTGTASVLGTGNSILGDSREQITDALTTTQVSATQTNQTETVITNSEQQTLTTSDSTSNANTGKYSSESTSLTTFVTQHQETTNQVLMVISDLTDADTDVQEIEDLLAGSFHTIANNQSFAASRREGNWVSGEVTDALDQTVSRLTTEETSSNQTLSATSTVSSAVQIDVVDVTNTVTGRYDSTDALSTSVIVRHDSTTNQGESTTSRDVAASTDHRVTDGNRITGQYEVTVGNSDSSRQLLQTLTNQSLQTVTSLVANSTMTTRSEVGNTITGQYDHILDGTHSATTDTTSTNQTDTVTGTVVVSSTTTDSSSGNSIIGLDTPPILHPTQPARPVTKRIRARLRIQWASPPMKFPSPPPKVIRSSEPVRGPRRRPRITA